MICSDLGANEVHTFTEEVSKYMSGIRLMPAGDMLKEASALRLLSECDAVLLFVQREKSRNFVIRKMLSQIQAYNKGVVGFVVSY